MSLEHNRPNPKLWSRRAQTPALLLAAFIFLTTSLSGQTAPAEAASAQPRATSFRQAVQLALQHSGVMAIATLNQWRTMKAYEEVRNHWIPQLTVGSGLGYSYGFPLTLEGSAPSVVNFTTNQALFNPSLKQFLKAAKIDWKAQSFDVQEKKNDVILDTALTYAQLDYETAKIATLQKALVSARKAQFVSEQRLKEGVDSQLDVTRSELVTARINLRIAEAQGDSDVLREHLARLIGMPASEIVVDEETIPALPAISQDDDFAARAMENSPSVRLADQRVAAAEARAKGEHRGTLPFADFASQYAYLARFNNYDQYYLKYNANNLSVGLNVRFPFFNSVQKARAAEADADALIARKQADLTRNQVEENALKTQRSLKQLQAARDVAKLEWQVAEGDLEAAQTRAQTGAANLRDLQNAELDAQDKYASYLDSNISLSKATLQLLRLTGELENWAIPTP